MLLGLLCSLPQSWAVLNLTNCTGIFPTRGELHEQLSTSRASPHCAQPLGEAASGLQNRESHRCINVSLVKIHYSVLSGMGGEVCFLTCSHFPPLPCPCLLILAQTCWQKRCLCSKARGTSLKVPWGCRLFCLEAHPLWLSRRVKTGQIWLDFLARKYATSATEKTRTQGSGRAKISKLI